MKVLWEGASAGFFFSFLLSLQVQLPFLNLYFGFFDNEIKTFARVSGFEAPFQFDLDSLN